MRVRAVREFRRGFTLIELLVVIAIIAVLIALLLAGRAGGSRGRPPGAVRQQPQAARPGRRQLRVANGVFPVAEFDCYCETPGSVHNGPSVFVALCPQMEQQSIYNAYNFSITWRSYPNVTVTNAQLEHPSLPERRGDGQQDPAVRVLHERHRSRSPPAPRSSRPTAATPAATASTTPITAAAP